MKPYLLTTGVVFALIIAGHGARVASEGTRLLTEPSFIITTLAALALCIWAFVLLRRTYSQGSRGSGE